MSEVAATVRRRVDPTSLTAGVAIGDVLLITLFVGVGEVNHGMPPWRFPMRMVGSLTPFLIGWAVTSFVGGLYTRDAWQFPLRAVSWTIPAWITAVLIAMGVRATAWFPGNAALSFGLVAVGFGLMLLVPWRTAIAVYDSR